MEEKLTATRTRGVRKEALSLSPLSTPDEPEGQPDTPFATQARSGLSRSTENSAATFSQGQSIRDGQRDETTAKKTAEKFVSAIVINLSELLAGNQTSGQGSGTRQCS